MRLEGREARRLVSHSTFENLIKISGSQARHWAPAPQKRPTAVNYPWQLLVVVYLPGAGYRARELNAETPVTLPLLLADGKPEEGGRFASRPTVTRVPREARMSALPPPPPSPPSRGSPTGSLLLRPMESAARASAFPCLSLPGAAEAN
jgi:hypothetical protein